MGTNFNPGDMATLTAQILAVVDALESATVDYATTSHTSAVAEADFRLRHSQAIVDIAARQLNRRTTAAERDAMAMLQVRSQYQTHLITKASADAARQALYALQHRLDALRTLAANVRAVTDSRAG